MVNTYYYTISTIWEKIKFLLIIRFVIWWIRLRELSIEGGFLGWFVVGWWIGVFLNLMPLLGEVLAVLDLGIQISLYDMRSILLAILILLLSEVCGKLGGKLAILRSLRIRKLFVVLVIMKFWINCFSFDDLIFYKGKS